MRRWLLGTVLALTLAAAPAGAQNLLITDYRIPSSSAATLRVNFGYDYRRVGSKEVENRGHFLGFYRYFYDSFRFAYSVDAEGRADKNEREQSFEVESTELVRAFVWRDLFVGGEFRRKFLSDAPSQADLLGSVGIGRFLNLTPLAKAVRMEDWLLELGQLKDDLPAETMIELGQLIQREREFRETYGEVYRKEWFAAMEAAIRRSGMLAVPELSAAALLRMEEVLTRERIFDRFVGWELSASAGVRVVDPIFGFQGRTRTAAFSFRYAKPFGWRTQWNWSLSVSSTLGDRFLRQLDGSAKTDFSFEMGNRVDLLLTYQADLHRADVPPGKRIWDPRSLEIGHRIEANLIFFIENRLTLNITGLVDSQAGPWHRNLAVTFGYRLL